MAHEQGESQISLVLSSPLCVLRINKELKSMRELNLDGQKHKVKMTHCRSCIARDLIDKMCWESECEFEDCEWATTTTAS